MNTRQRVFATLAAVSGLAGLLWLVATRSSAPHEAVEPGPPSPEQAAAPPRAAELVEAPAEGAENAPPARTEPESEAERAERLVAESVKAECTYWSEALERRVKALGENPADLERLQLLARDAVVALLFSQGRFEQRELGRSYVTPPRSVGHAIQVAGRFGPQAFLVLPAEFPEYWEVLEWLERPEAEQRDAARAPERFELGARIEALALIAREALVARAKEL
ncbi:MAG: hypothetical protein NTV21_03090 [Planctomycetota bacterium]|nr:hypothetical protein [Planctomycetota bacterium]